MNRFTIWYTGISVLYTIFVGTNCQNVPVTSASTPCTVDFPNMHCGPETTRIPVAESSTRKIQRMYLRNCPKLIFHDDDFAGYNDLTELCISSVSMTTQTANIPLNKFATLANLKYLEFAASGLTDQHMWILPQSIEAYNVSDNKYTYLNVSHASKLEKIIADKNQLQYLPLYSNPPPPLQTMNLLDNPLDKLAVEFLLPLCQLHQVQWMSMKNSFPNTTKGICDCLRLYKWIKKFHLQDFHIECQTLPDEMECDLSFGQIKSLRKNCSDAEKIPNSPTPPAFPFTIEPVESPATALAPASTAKLSPPPATGTSAPSSATPPPTTLPSTHSYFPTFPPASIPSFTTTELKTPEILFPPEETSSMSPGELPVSSTDALLTPVNIEIPTVPPDTSIPGWIMFILGSVVASAIWLSLAGMAFVVAPKSPPISVFDEDVGEE